MIGFSQSEDRSDAELLNERLGTGNQSTGHLVVIDDAEMFELDAQEEPSVETR